MKKFIINLLLCILIVMSVLPQITSAKSVSSGTSNEMSIDLNQSQFETDNVLSVAWLSSHYSIAEESILNQLNRGYSITEIYQALEEEKTTQTPYTENLFRINPSVQQQQDELANMINDTLRIQAPTDTTEIDGSLKSDVLMIPSVLDVTYHPYEPSVLDATYAKGLMTMSNEPTTYDKTVVKRLELRSDQAPYNVSNGNESISTMSGDLNLQYTDLVLPGRNGLSFGLTRSYDSSQSYFYESNVEEEIVNSYYFRPEYHVRVFTDPYGNYEYSVSNIKMVDKFSMTFYNNQKIERNAGQQYPKESWHIPYFNEISGSLFTSEISEYERYLGEGKYKYVDPQVGNAMFAQTLYLSSPPQIPGISSFVLKFYPTGRVFVRGAFGGVMDFKARNISKYTLQSPLGRGWDWDMSKIETKRGNTYLRLEGGATYEIDSSNKIVGYPWKDMTLTNNTSVTVNNIVSSRMLTTLQGTKYYFSGSGKLIQKSDAYGNTLQFHYTNVSPYGEVMTKVIDALGNQIDITYSSTEVVATNGDRVVRYQKQMAPNTTDKELLSAVTDSGDRTTRYTYDVSSGNYSLLPSSYASAVNYFALLKVIEHPTGVQTEYNYTPYSRKIGKQDEYEVVFRNSSREDVLYKIDGTKERKNLVLNSGADLTYGYSTSFQTVRNDGRTETIYTFKKQYIDDNTPSTYYNTNIEQRVIGTIPLEKTTITQTFDETKRLPAPLTVTSINSKGTTNSTAVTRSTAYDDYGNVTSETDPNNITTAYTYDPNTHLLSHVSQPIKPGLASYTEYERYAPQGSIKKITVKDNNASGALKAQTNYTYDAFGNPNIVTIKDDTRNIGVNFEYGATYNAGYPTKQSVQVTATDGTVSTVAQHMSYNKLTGELTKYVDGNGNETSYLFDKLGRLTTVTLPDAGTQSVIYNDVTNEVMAIDPTEVTTIIKWNPFGLKESEGILGKGAQRYEYDIYGRLAGSYDGANNRTGYVYDNLDRITLNQYPIVQVKDAAGNNLGADNASSSVQYDDINRIVQTTDAEGNKTKELFDISGRLERQEALNPSSVLASSASYTYDYLGNALTMTDGVGNITSYNYDAMNRLVSVTDPELNTTSYTYSLASELKQIEYPDHNKVMKQYDEMGRVIKETDPSGKIETYYYDANSNLTKVVDRKGQIRTFGYNNRDLQTSNVTSSETISYKYDKSGRREWMQDNTGKTQYVLEPATGWLDTVIYPDNRQMHYQYDNQGMRESMTDPFGVVTTYKYDARNQLEAVGPAIDNWDVTYQYKKNGLSSSTQLRNGITSTFGYNELNLMSLSQTKAGDAFVNTFTYDYDLNRNQKLKSENSISNSYTYDKLNRIFTATENSEHYTYDNRGNRQTLQSDKPMSFVGTSYQYDDRDRLTQANHDDGAAVGYRYNGDGLLTERTEAGSTTRYYYDGANIIAEGTVTNGVSAHKASYIRGNQLVARIDSTGNKAYYLLNGHGDVIGLTDGAGNTLNQYTYDIWGNPITEQETIPNPFRYSGELWDEATELQYLRARWYDPSMGRFINEDTYDGQINNPLTLNLYTYVGNNPLIRWDPSGHHWVGDQWNGFVRDMKQVHSSWYSAADYWSMGLVSDVDDYIKVSKEKPMSVEQWGKAANLFIQVTPMKAGTVVTKTAKAVSTVKWSASNFAEGKLDVHFQKHVVNKQEWSDLGYSLTKAGYLVKAKSLLNSKIGGDIRGFTSENGYVFRYNAKTNEFATGKPDGTIETLFRPKDGIKYWFDQIKAYGG